MKLTGIQRAAAAALLGLACGPVLAEISLRLLAPALVTQGHVFSLQLSIDGLGPAGDGLALAAFDFDLLLDPALVSFVEASFGKPGGASGLDAGVGGSLQGLDAGRPDRVNFSEVSLESAEDLLAVQPNGFRLLEVRLLALAPGQWNAQLQGLTLSDAQGGALSATLLDGAVLISAVPEPAQAWLLSLGLAGLVALRRRAQSPSSTRKISRP